MGTVGDYTDPDVPVDPVVPVVPEDPIDIGDQEDQCAQDEGRIELLQMMLDAKLEEEYTWPELTESFEQCYEEQYEYGGTNLWLSFKMADDSYTHVKFYMDFETEEWDI